ncbi:MAG TPA: V-type ATP synthase subunit I [Clostridiaceae bacterium]|nr:V-type ATP synthase subunit I [Clostridiaceae bacterium]
MSILKMKFISIVGQEDYFGEFVQKYIIDSSIQLENALSHLETVKGLSPYGSENTYYDLVTRSTSLLNSMGLGNKVNDDKAYKPKIQASADDIRRELDTLEQIFKENKTRYENMKEQFNKYTHMKKQLELLVNLEIDIKNFFEFEFIKFRFGRMPKKSYEQLKLFMADLDAIIFPISRDKDYVWLIYFTPRRFGEKIDGIFSSLYFERVRISAELSGTPSEALIQIEEKMSSLQEEMKEAEKAIKDFINNNEEKIADLYYSSVRLNRISEVRKYAAHTLESFYVMGWIPEEELKTLIPRLDADEKVLYIHEEPDSLKTSQPPTELRNNKIFKPFEMFVRMYGLPSYNEIDPTAFVAITYFIMFGLMFGDVGQGLVLFAAGVILMMRKVAIGGIIVGAGLSSTIFGFVYGSVFGFEDWIKPLWINPMENINTMLITGIIVGFILITSAILLNIVNGIKCRNLARILLDKNGVAGLVFYWGIAITAIFMLQEGKPFLSAGITTIMLLVPIVVMFLKEPLENLINRKRFLPHNKGIFFVQTFFELFDTVLSFLSNTISFIRLSAFALNHVGLFMAVFILSEMAEGAGSLAAIIIGNILIIGLEGLIVGIQALRLEYYELFSRFFTGDGRPYKPLKNQNHL